jgi:sterol 3beta-glucosyltransferase
MRFAIVCVGAQGDVRPFIALARELQLVGHQVVIATFKPFFELVRGFGVDCIPMQPFYNDKKPPIHTRFAISIYRPVENKEGYLAELWRACKEAEADVILYNNAAYCCFYIAENLGIPSFGAFTQPNLPTTVFPQPFATTGYPWGGMFNKAGFFIHSFLHWQIVRKSVNRWRKDTLGLAPLSFRDTLLRQVARMRPPLLYGYSPSLVPRPCDWNMQRVEVTGYWFLDTKAFDPPIEVIQFLQNGPPPVFISVVLNLDRFDRETIFRTIGQLESRVIVQDLYGAIKDMASTEKILYLKGPIPHEWLFKRISLAVHHGGTGITMSCLRLGVPMVVIPSNGVNDHRFWAYCVSKAGVGMHLSVSKGNKRFAEKLASAIKKVMNSADIKRNITEMSKSVSEEKGVKNAVSFILKETGKYDR